MILCMYVFVAPDFNTHNLVLTEPLLVYAWSASSLVLRVLKLLEVMKQFWGTPHKQDIDSWYHSQV